MRRARRGAKTPRKPVTSQTSPSMISDSLKPTSVLSVLHLLCQPKEQSPQLVTQDLYLQCKKELTSHFLDSFDAFKTTFKKRSQSCARSPLCVHLQGAFRMALRTGSPVWPEGSLSWMAPVTRPGVGENVEASEVRSTPQGLRSVALEPGRADGSLLSPCLWSSAGTAASSQPVSSAESPRAPDTQRGGWPKQEPGQVNP